MAVIQRQTTINASDEEIFKYLADVSKHPEWAAHNLEVQPASQGPVQAGSAFDTVGHQFGSQPGKVTITELVPNQKIVYESDGRVGHFRHGFILEKTDEGVRVTKSVEPLKISSLPLKVMSPFVSSVIAPRGLDGDLKRIKERLEDRANP